MAEYYVFAGDYQTGMDRHYEPVSLGSYEMPLNKIGISTPPFKEQLESLKARIFQGASKVELGFTGMQKGSMGQSATTPEMYGRDEREAIRDMAKVNRIELSTHAAPGATGASGFDQRQGKFTDEHQKLVIDEIKRTVDFAADTAGGGPVVMHVGEWQRPLFDLEKSEKYREKFESYPGEKEKGVMYAVEEKTGQLIPIPKDIEIFQPKMKDGEFEYNKDGTVLMDKLGYDDALKRAKEQFPDLNPEQAFFRFQHDSEIRRARAEALRFRSTETREKEQLKALGTLKEYWGELEKRTPKEKQDILRASFNQTVGERYHMQAREGESILKTIDEAKNAAERELEWMKGISAAASQNVKQVETQLSRIKPIEDIGVKKTANAISEMAMYAYDVGKMKKLEKPIYISPENIFPEQYGGHPQELKRIILESRKAMADKLVSRGFEESQASKIAEEHVKATFDIGHAYTWRRYFKGSDPADIEKTNKEFKSWVMDNVKDLLKSNVIGHVHISDNFGYYDEHVTPGQGIVPIKEFIAELKKANVTDIVVEPAHQDFKTLLGAWEHFGSSIYSALMPWGGKDRWADVQFSYFGKTSGPNYIVGDIRPSEEWTLWSQTPLE